MSLEIAIAANTAAIQELTSVWSMLATMGTTINKNVEAGTQSVVDVAGKIEIPVAAPAAKPAAPKSSKAAATPVAAEKAPVEAEPAVVARTEEAPADVVEEITYAAVAAAVTALSKAKGRAAAVAILAKFEVTALPGAKPEQFADIKSACEAELV